MNSSLALAAFAASYTSAIRALLREAPPAIPTPAPGAGIILTPPSPPNASAVRMELNLNTLLNDTAKPLQGTRALPPELLKPQVIEAVVLRNTLLAPANPTAPAQPPSAAPLPQPTLPPGGQPPLPQLPLLQIPAALLARSAAAPATPGAQQPATMTTPAQVKVELSWQGRLIQLASPQPLPPGTQVRIEVTARGDLQLLATRAPAAPPSAAVSNAALPPEVQQAVRENLPRQRPLADALPLLRQLARPERSLQLPPPVARAIGELLQRLPQPQQLQSAEGVRRAIADSGAFMESRAGTATAASEKPVPALLTTLSEGGNSADIKAQVVRLIALIRLFAPQQPPAQPVPESELVYTARPQPRADTARGAEPAPAEGDQLQQLSKLLQAGLARIQLNQLEGVASRHLGGVESQAPSPSWVMELPINTPRGADNLQLRIEQQRRQRGDQVQMQWTVQLTFDLHELGRLAATLTILGKQVAATLWAEQSHTHHIVRNELEAFRAALEGVGVQVGEVRCRHGLPPAQSRLVSQQLVDVHT